MELDRIDRRIVALLQRDARMTHAAIADAVHLSPSACLRRVRRLEESGVISGYHAVLDRERIGLGTTVFVEISLDSQHEHHLDEFEAAVEEVPEVVNCHLMAGDFDYLLQVVAADVADYERIHRTQMARLPHVAKVRSSFALRGVVERGPLAPESD
ncbi:MAG: Lrp/AsnC family transcriptional regulator [Actinomycetota bacterium]